MSTDDQERLTKKELQVQRGQEKKAAQDLKVQELKKRKNKKILSFVIALIIGLGFVWFVTLPSSNTSVDFSEILQLNAQDWTKGNEEADVVLVEYLDFECEACGAYFPIVKQLSEEFSDDVLFIARYFPLSSHKNSMTSARAVEAAGKQGKYWEMHDLVFENQSSWGERSSPDATIFEDFAQQLGLDMERYKDDVNSEEVGDRISSDQDSGNQLGVNATPTFFLNGEKIQNPQGYEAFKALLEQAISQ